jgi:PKD repeat protein
VLKLGGSDPDGNALTYVWDLGDGTHGVGPTAPTLHTYADNGSYTITLVVDDGHGGVDRKVATATIGNVAPKASFGYPSSLTIGGTIPLSLTGASDASSVDASAGFTYAFDCGDGAGYGAYGAVSAVNCPASAPGIRTVKAAVKDKDGGVTEYSGAVQVLYPFSGFYAPVDHPDVAVNVAKAGSGIPVKFSLGGDRGLQIFADGYPKSVGFRCDISDTPDVVEQTVNATNSGLTYDAASGQYVYVWKTDKGWAGSCRRLTVRLADGTDHVADFKFVK